MLPTYRDGETIPHDDRPANAKPLGENPAAERALAHACEVLQRLGCDAARVLHIDSDPEGDAVLYETPQGKRATAFLSTVERRGERVPCLVSVAPGYAAVSL